MVPLVVFDIMYDFNTHKKEEGFIALISILILSSVLLATTLSLAQFGLANRFFILNLEQKASSQKMAEACLEMLRIKVYSDPAYTTTTKTTYILAGSDCSVVSVIGTGTKTVKVSATEDGAITNLQADINSSTGDYISVTEVDAL